MFQQTEIREGKWAKVGNNKQCGLPLGVCKAYVAVLRSDIVGEALRTFGHAISDFRRPHGLILSNVFKVYNCYFSCEIGEILRAMVTPLTSHYLLLRQHQGFGSWSSMKSEWTIR